MRNLRNRCPRLMCLGRAQGAGDRSGIVPDPAMKLLDRPLDEGQTEAIQY